MNTYNVLEDVLNSITPEEAERIEKRMLMAAKIDDAIKAKGWKKKDLMQALGKANQSEITKWLSGTHNFTMDLLTDLGRVLGVDFLNVEKVNPPMVETHYKVMPVIVTVRNSSFSYMNEMFSAKTIYDKTITTQNEPTN